MIAKEFLSTEVSIALPRAAAPKVYLAIDTSQIAKLSFQLYNPFSLKGKLLKWVAQLLCVRFNSFARLVLPTESKNKSYFIEHLEKEIGKKLVSSVYLATANDKVVLQLIHNNQIYGYLKYPISTIGRSRLMNEQLAITSLSSNRNIPHLIYQGIYQKMPFIILPNIEGSIGAVSKIEYDSILKTFSKGKSYDLKLHPRVLNLSKKLAEINLPLLQKRLNEIVGISKMRYKEVYEHGDFAPWNIIRTSKGLVPFDFEYYTADGLEYLDEIKFNFQIEHLLNGKKGINLIESISKKIEIAEFEIIFQIFLLKEIVHKKLEDQSYEMEMALLLFFNGNTYNSN